jgi:hypothetical protein
MNTVGELREALARYPDDQPLRVREDAHTISGVVLREFHGRIVLTPKPRYTGRNLRRRSF